MTDVGDDKGEDGFPLTPGGNDGEEQMDAR